MKTKTVPKTAAQVRAEFAAMPEANRSKDRRGMRVTEHGTLSRLQPGMVVEIGGEEHVVEMVNDCRARCLPLNKKKSKVRITDKLTGEVREFEPETTGGAVNISPNADCKILRNS
jgi:hypothetical protein